MAAKKQDWDREVSDDQHNCSLFPRYLTIYETWNGNIYPAIYDEERTLFFLSINVLYFVKHVINAFLFSAEPNLIPIGPVHVY